MPGSSSSSDTLRTVLVRRLPVSLLLNGAPVESETSVVDARAWVVCFATTIDDPRAPLTLNSTYVGAPGAVTRAIHLRCGPDRGEAHTDTTEHSADALPVWQAHDRLLLDHLQAVVERATMLDLSLTVGELDDALASLAV